MFLGIGVFAFNGANAASYKLDNAKVDKLFDSAEESGIISFAEVINVEGKMALPSSVISVKEKDPVAAILLDFFLGGLGIHRFYLGTKTMTGVGYILTCGGIFGLVPFVDLIVLIVNMDDISRFVDNPKFFMWSE